MVYDYFSVPEQKPRRTKSLETSNYLGLCDVYLDQMALPGFMTQLKVYSVVLCFFFITFENKEIILPVYRQLNLGEGQFSKAHRLQYLDDSNKSKRHPLSLEVAGDKFLVMLG